MKVLDAIRVRLIAILICQYLYYWTTSIEINCRSVAFEHFFFKLVVPSCTFFSRLSCFKTLNQTQSFLKIVISMQKGINEKIRS